MIRRPPRSTQSRSSAASDVYKRQHPVRVDDLPQRDASSLSLCGNAESSQRNAALPLGLPCLPALWWCLIWTSEAHSNALNHRFARKPACPTWCLKHTTTPTFFVLFPKRLAPIDMACKAAKRERELPWLARGPVGTLTRDLAVNFASHLSYCIPESRRESKTKNSQTKLFLFSGGGRWLYVLKLSLKYRYIHVFQK